MRKAVLFLSWLILLALNSNKSFAQQFPSYEILPAGEWNYEYLNALIRKGIDSVRLLHGAAPLANNQILFNAASHHARYLDERKMLSHFQKEFAAFKEPHDRVLHFGGKAFTMTGENVALSYAFVPVKGKDDADAHTNLTYSQLAYDFVKGWVHSPGHFRNIITKGFNQTGVATIFNPADKSVRAVQVFGRLDGESIAESAPEFDFEKFREGNSDSIGLNTLISMAPHSQAHDWNIEDGRAQKELCNSCFPGTSFMDQTNLYLKGNEVWLYTEDIQFVKNVLHGHHDGFVLEFVTYTAFDCGNSQYYSNLSRRNQGCIFNGKTSKPIFTKDAFDGFVKIKESDENQNSEENSDKKKKPEKNFLKDFWNLLFPKYKILYYNFKIGNVPEGLNGAYEINLLILKKNKLCNVIHFSGLCGDKMTFNPGFSELRPSFSQPWKAPEVIKKFSIRLPFEKNRYEAAAENFTLQMKSVMKHCDKIDSVRIMAFSSVEGEHEVNAELQRKRAKTITDIIQKSQLDTLISEIKTAENWALMHQQIQTNRNLSILKNKSDEEIEELVNQEKNLSAMEPFLKLQRYAQIELTGTKEEKAIPDINWLSKKAGRYFEKINKTKGDYTATEFRDSLRDLQTYIFQLALKKEFNIQLVEKLKIPQNNLYTEFLFRNLWMKHYFSDLPQRQKDSIFFMELSSPALRNPQYFSPRYTWTALGMKYSFMKFRNHKEVQNNLLTCRDLLKSAPDSLMENIRENLLAMHMQAIEFYSRIPHRYRNSRFYSIKFVYDYWKSRPEISDSIALDVCNYLISLNAFPFARDLVFPLAMKENPSPELLMQAVKLSYTHSDNELNFYSFREFLLHARKWLSREQWCGMFAGPCNISFQVWDDPEIRDVYCQECRSLTNYAENYYDPIPD